uniref:HUN domain-containing protein n=1 Tax=Caenorhabditis tropicalis TaxID=1561998 RepID=A0A1I7TF00_9PELO
MRSGENTPAHPTSHDLNDVDFAENTEETNIEDELQQLDVASFERILRSIAASKTDLLKDESTGIDPAIMGLIDDAKERLTAETDRNNTLRPNDQPVKFDDVFDYIDDGVEEVVIEKPPVVVAKKVATMIKPPVRGNPVTDYDKLNEMNGFHEHYENLDKDIVSRMEMGHAQAFDDVDLEKLTKCQKNIRCDEKEQMDWLEQKGLTEFSKYDTILGPVSKGEFVSYNQTSTQAVGCDIGVMNPISVKNMNVFKTVIPMGHLVKSVPRLFFLPNDSSPKPTRKPGGITSVHKPFTMMLKTVSPSHFTTQVPESQLLNLHMQPEKEEANVQKENINQKKRKSKSKKTSEPSLNVDSDEMNSSVEDIDKQGKDIVDDEKENKEDGLTEQEREARRIRNVKNRNKKKQKKAVEKKLEEARKESDTPVDPQSTLLDSSRKLVKSGRESIPFGAPSSNQDKMTKDLPNGANRRVLGGKSKKNMKSVSSEYTVENDSSPDLLQAASGECIFA